MAMGLRYGEEIGGESGLEAQIHLHAVWRELPQNISAEKILEGQRRGTATKKSKGRPETELRHKAGRRSVRCGNMMGKQDPQYGGGSAWYTGHIQ